MIPPQDPAQHWHVEEPDGVARALDTSISEGLTSAEAGRRLAVFGANEIERARGRSAWQVFAGQFRDAMILMLVAAAAISAAIGELVDSLAIVAILVLNALIGGIQELRAERAIEALRRLAAARATAIRDGGVIELGTAGLVPGDIVLVEAGNVVPADLRLVEASSFSVDESALTGESVAVEKLTAALSDPGLTLGDRSNMAWKGTIAARGRARGIVVASGMRTELGRIARLIEGGREPPTPLQVRLAELGRRLAIAALTICALVFAFGIARGEAFGLMFMTAVSLAVAAVPEALPAVVTIALALGAARMVRHQALIRRLPAVETLGSVSVICSDKTGTLTQNRMWVESLHVPGGDGLMAAAAPGAVPDALFPALALNNSMQRDAQGAWHGEATEAALAAAAHAAGCSREDLERRWPRVAEIPFDSVRKRMTTLHRNDGRIVAFVKGAPELVLPLCDRVRLDGAMMAFSAAGELEVAARMAADGMRVIAVAAREFEAVPRIEAVEVERELEFIGLVGLIDPPRPEAAEAVQTCIAAGITPMMITGDHPATAANIASRLGIAGPASAMITGAELGRISDEELALRVRDARVYARVDPEQKIRIVEALQRQGLCVAMTGDGVNDAPALKRADVGVAMGRGGTDVAREASALVLLDDNFATIVRAVAEGRRIYNNIRRFVRFVLGGNTGEILAIFVAPFAGMPIPLLPLHLLWVNLLTDGLPGLALAAEPAAADVMRRPPRPRGESIFAHGMWQHILWVGALIAVLTLGVQAWAWRSGNPHWQTMAFTVLTFSQLAHAMAIRSERTSTFTLGIASNRALLGAVALTAALHLAVIYVPAANAVFHTVPLGGFELAVCALAALTVFFAVEAEKWLIRNRGLYGGER